MMKTKIFPAFLLSGCLLFFSCDAFKKAFGFLEISDSGTEKAAETIESTEQTESAKEKSSAKFGKIGKADRTEAVKNPALSNFYEICASGTKKQVSSAIKNGAGINTVDKDGFSPLFYAVLGNPKKYFDSVIQIRSALKEDNDEKLYSALENSPCVKGNFAALKILIQNGANVQLTDRNKNSAFLYASLFCNNPEILKELIKAGADSSELLYKEPMLTYAAFTNDSPECVRYLADLGKNVDYANSHGTTPIMWAAMYNKNPAVIDALISAGADINDTRHENGYTPLHWAVRCNRNPAMAEHIIKLGADINKEDKYGSTPLLWAVCSSNPKDVIKETENAFNNISTTSFNATRYFEKIQQKGKPEIIPVLLKNNPSDESLKDAYLLAYCLSSAKVANMILEKIESSKITYDDDYLFWLCLSQDDEKINALKKILLKPENKFSYDSSKLFFWAFYLKNPKALQVFTDDFGISSEFETVKSAIALSTQKEYLEPVIKSCKNVNKQTVYGETLLHYAVNRDNIEAVKSLIRNGAKIDMRYGNDYLTELLTAVNKSYPNTEIVRALINAGADVNARDKDGAAVLIYAVNKNYTPNVANILISAGASKTSRYDGKYVYSWCNSYIQDTFLYDSLKNAAGYGSYNYY